MLKLSAMSFIRQSRRLSSTYVRFDEFLRFRRNQAAKSMLIQVSGKDSSSDVKSYLTSNFGPLAGIYHYSVASSVKRVTRSAPSVNYHWVIAEFENKASLEEALKACRYPDNAVPFRSHMCWFSKPLMGLSKSTTPLDNSIISENLDEKKSSLNIPLPVNSTIAEQMKILQMQMKVSETSMRARFLTVHHLEQSVKALFPNACALPFGSSVSGIGSNSGDLDLVLLLEEKGIFPKSKARQKKIRLQFQRKMLTSGGAADARHQTVRTLELLGDIVRFFIPGYSQTHKILGARVPIIRFVSDFTGLHCDLCYGNSSGVFMSELIYMMGCIDNRFQPLIVTIRSWAAARNITNPVPGAQPTNFMFVMMVINFLQHKQILPTWGILFNNATKEDTRVTEDGIDCTYLRDIGELQKYFFPKNGHTTLEELLYEFFEFYANFDFAAKGISLLTGSTSDKPINTAMYIQNPLDRQLNVSRNVNINEVSRLQNEFRSALRTLEAKSSGQSKSLTDLFRVSVDSQHMRQIEVKKLLED
ncbi:unnamed protein product [Allacma fusca]|uniref:Poly(A) RNA polymerase, mitochondrial n=1 Tax=Allacma fusca TaxID=39272 RepID=A0A8J2K7E8_9HEXA|nr:unnamed protein product [Allacma fusca]